MTINHHVSRSSMISEVEYDDENKVLTVTFTKGSRYEYSDVSKDVYEALINAESIGQYFSAHIKNKYTTVKL